MTGPPVQVWPGAVLLQRQALSDVYLLVSAGIRAIERNGYSDDRFDGIRRAIRDAAVSLQRHGDTSSEADCAECAGDDEVAVDPIDTAEAATMLGVSRRSCQRLAKQGLGRRVGDRWVLDRDSVIAAAQARNQARKESQ